MNTNINFRVPQQLLEDFERACQQNYTNKSEVLRRAMLEYVRQNKARSGKMYRVQSIKYANGEYVPGTEKTLYEGNLLEAITVFNQFEETDDETAIVSEYIEDEDRWEIIKEK